MPYGWLEILSPSLNSWVSNSKEKPLAAVYTHHGPRATARDLLFHRYHPRPGRLMLSLQWAKSKERCCNSQVPSPMGLPGLSHRNRLITGSASLCMKKKKKKKISLTKAKSQIVKRIRHAVDWGSIPSTICGPLCIAESHPWAQSQEYDLSTAKYLSPKGKIFKKNMESLLLAAGSISLMYSLSALPSVCEGCKPIFAQSPQRP